MSHYPFIRVSGTPYEMGYQHGRQAAERIKRFVEIILKNAGVPEAATRRDVLERTKVFEPMFRHYVPELVEEIEGLKDGAGISFEETLLIQIRGEISHVGADLRVCPQGCTTFVLSGDVTADGKILIGQNSDMHKEQEEVAIVLRLTPAHGPRILMWTFGGHLGYHGMNSAGVAHFANALGGGPAWKLGLPHYPIKRKMLEQRTVAEALRRLDAMPVCSSGNYVLCGGCKTICDVELTPDGYAVLRDEGAGFIVHSNHFLSPKFRTADTDAQSLPDSFHRLPRLHSLIQSERGRVTVDDVKRFLADHANHPQSICRHTVDMKTVASLIAEPERGRFHVCAGNPCEGEWVTYEV
jgi:isopenicillin-N N-acyltransferase-like protein